MNDHFLLLLALCGLSLLCVLIFDAEATEVAIKRHGQKAGTKAIAALVTLIALALFWGATFAMAWLVDRIG